MTDTMHPYRTHTCGAPRPELVGQTVRLSGWVHRKRDHGNLLFIDLRDLYGITQCVIDTSSELFPIAPMVPATCVPWPYSSAGSESLKKKS